MKRLLENISGSYFFLIIGSGILFFFTFLGHVHLFDWDEVNFAESAREMIVTGDYFRVRIDYNPFWEKPPFFFWLQVLSMKLFGVNEYAARFPNAFFGLVTLSSLFFIGRKLKNTRFGFLWALIYMGSFLPHLYFKSGIIDPVFNCFIFLSIYFLYRAVNDELKHLKHALFAGLFNGLAVLTKGPVGFLLLAFTFLIFLIIKRFKIKLRIKDILVFTLMFLVTVFLWFGAEVINNGPWFIVEFVRYQIDLFLTPVAGHEQPIYYHFIVVFLGCFPLSVFALGGFSKRAVFSSPNFKVWMAILFWVVMILFTIVKTKIVHYSSMAYLPLSFLAVLYLEKLLNKQLNPKKWLLLTFLITGTIFALLLTLLPIFANNKHLLIPYIKDDFALAGFQAPIVWNGWEFIIGIFFLAGVIFSYFLMKRNKISRGILVISYSVCITLFFYLFAVVPKIEGYSQRPVIEFYKSIRGEDAYVTTIGFKSYAHYFYFRANDYDPEDKILGVRDKVLAQEENATVDTFQNLKNNWLLNGDIDKPVYFVTKITHPHLENNKGVKKIGSKGGFVFYRRLP